MSTGAGPTAKPSGIVLRGIEWIIVIDVTSAEEGQSRTCVDWVRAMSGATFPENCR